MKQGKPEDDNNAKSLLLFVHFNLNFLQTIVKGIAQFVSHIVHMSSKYISSVCMELNLSRYLSS